MSKNYITYFTMANGSFRYMSSNSDKIGTYIRIPNTVKRKFSVFKGYAADDEGLREFTYDFRKWAQELKKSFKIDYTFYYTHHIAVEAIFKQTGSGPYNRKTTKKWNIEQVTVIEESYISKCSNGGLTYCKKYEGQCYGYDFNSAYPRMMANDTYLIPTEQGIEKYTDVKTHMENKTLQYGMYYIQITSTHPDAKKYLHSPLMMYTLTIQSCLP